MMRRSLLHHVCTRQTSAKRMAYRSPLRVDLHCNPIIDGPRRTNPICFAYHTTSYGAQDFTPRKGEILDRKAAKKDHSHRGGGKRRNPGHTDGFDPSQISQLEQRAKDHCRKFPGVSSPLLISPWHRTTVELIQSMSKIWGRNHRSDPLQIGKFALCCYDLVLKVLLIRKKELDDMSEENKGGDSYVRIQGKRPKPYQHVNTEFLCQTVALGFSRCNPKVITDAARKAEEMLEKLEDICSGREKLGRDTKVGFELHDVTPSIKLYNNVLSCWSRSLDPNAETHAQKLMDRMKNSQGIHPRPMVISYNNMLNLFANNGKVDKAKALLEEMEGPSFGLSPDVFSYTIVMNAFQKRFTSSGSLDRNMKDPELVEEILSHLVSRYEKSGFRDSKLRPSNVTFGTAISIYAQADRILKEDDRNSGKTRSWKAKDIAMSHNANNTLGWGARNAERVLDWMIGLSERERRSKNMISSTSDSGRKGGQGIYNPEHEAICATSYHFVTVMDAWAKAGMGVEGAEHCERLLNRLISLYDKLGHPELRPSPLCFGPAIDAWAKADEEYETAKHAESLLDRLEELFLDRKSSNPKEMLSNIAYNLVIDAWSRRSGGDAPERAESILSRMNSNYQLTRNRFVRPDVISYTNVMKAHVNHPNGGNKALSMLEEMNIQWRDGNERAKPDSKALAVAMDACAKSGLTHEAERILDEVDDSKKTRVMLNTIIAGYRAEGRGNEAEAILGRMIDLSDKAGWQRCSPDVVSYSLCIDAWGNSTSHDRSSRVKALLEASIERFKSGDSNCKPSHLTFNTAADAISKSDDPDREAGVLAIFEKMEDIGCEPNIISFNILIKTCAYATGSEDRKRNALSIAFSAFNSLSAAGLKADSVTYTSMFHATRQFIEDKDEKVTALKGLFQKCCDDGCLNEHILNIVTGATSEDAFLTITGVQNTQDIHSLPVEWSRYSSPNFELARAS